MIILKGSETSFTAYQGQIQQEGIYSCSFIDYTVYIGHGGQAMIGFSIKKPFLDNQIASKINSKSISRTQGIGGYRREYVRKKMKLNLYEVRKTRNNIANKWNR